MLKGKRFFLTGGAGFIGTTIARLLADDNEVVLYDNLNNRYLIANIRQMPMPSTEPEVLEDWKPFYGYTDIDGCVWQFKAGPMV